MATRQIENKMVQFIDDKLAKNGMAQDAIKNKDARALFVHALSSCVGIREKGGNNRGPMVELIQETIGSAGGEAWCMALVQTGLAYVEGKLDVKSPIIGSEHCLTTWRESPKAQRVKLFPARGAIIIWQHGTSESGHTGIFLEAVDNNKNMLTVEGNTESGLDRNGGVVSEGGGVYAAKRSMTKNGSMKVVGFLKPFG